MLQSASTAYIVLANVCAQIALIWSLPALFCVPGMTVEGAQTSLGQTPLRRQTKVRLKRTGSCAPGEPFDPDPAVGGEHRGLFEKAGRETEDENWLDYQCPQLGEWLGGFSRYTSCLHIGFDGGMRMT